MTINRFRKLLQKINPKLRVRQRGYGDVVGIFAGLSGKSGYILRMTKGEFTLAGYREQIVDPLNNIRMTEGIIKKRGRKTAVNLLRNWRWLTHHKQRSSLLWGIDYER